MSAPALPDLPPGRCLLPDPDGGRILVLDQTQLPHERRVVALADEAAVVEAIVTMRLRGAPLIGIAGAYGLALAVSRDPSNEAIERAATRLVATRPTAVNLAWAVERVRRTLHGVPERERARVAWEEAGILLDAEIEVCRRIGEYGLPLLERAWQVRRAKEPGATALHVLTHCNAGWLATGGYGTALAPVYRWHETRGREVPIHVWVDETRPRSQGASLTAWELAEAGVPHTVIADTAAGHVLQRGRADACFVGSDRTTARGDVGNKIGTYLVALAAHDNGVPFYACVPSSSIDWTIQDGVREIPIEERGADEVTTVFGRSTRGVREGVRIAPDGASAANFAFDVTPSRLVSAIVTEFGVFEARATSLAGLRAQVSEEAGRAR